MGILDRAIQTFTQMMRTGSPSALVVPASGGQPEYLFQVGSSDGIDGASVSQLWKAQPHLRTVVNFLARNVAHVGLHVYKDGVEGRERVRTGALPGMITRPNPVMTGYELLFALVGYIALYDRAYLWVTQSAEGSPEVRVVPSDWVSPVEADAFRGPKSYLVTSVNGEAVKVPTDELVPFLGWTPGDPINSTSPVESLRLILEEQHHSRVHRKQLWKRNGRIGSYVSRPAADGVKVPQWGDAERRRFMAMLDAFMGDRGARAGGMPLVEDGMKIETSAFKSADEQWAESIKLSLATVAQVYHINPTMVGLLDNANYSNVREFRRGLYGDTLGPIFKMIEERLNAFLLPQIGVTNEFVEFNVEAKLRGSFEEQAEVMSSAIGGPWMTRNEGRRMRNLPPVEGGDDLIVPLNLGTPDAASGQVPPADPAKIGQPEAKAAMITATQIKTRLPDDHETEYRETLLKFFERQRRVVSDKYGAKAGQDWWDAERWDRELTEDLLTMNDAAAVAAAKMILSDLGVDATFDRERIAAWLAEYSRVAAESINEQTLALLEEAIASEQRTIADTYEATTDKRSTELAVAAITAMSAFGQIEAMRQAPGEATKTWITGRNPRPAHAAMDGQTVDLDEKFSNGMSWPGDPAGDADDLAGCNCSLLINYQEDAP